MNTEEGAINKGNGSMTPTRLNQVLEASENTTGQGQECSDEMTLTHTECSSESDFDSIPKTIRYNGRDNWEAFKMKFTGYAQAKQWTTSESMECLSLCLEGQASEFYTSAVKRDPGVKFADLMTKLEMRCGYCELPESVYVRFSTLVQKHDESSIRIE